MFLRGGGISIGIRLRSYSSIVGERSSRRKGIVREIALIFGGLGSDVIVGGVVYVVLVC